LAELYQRRGDNAQAEEHRKAAESIERRVWPDPFVDETKRLQTGLRRFLEQATTLLLENRVADAMRLLQKTTQEYPKSERSWVLIAEAHSRQKDWSAAEQAARRALEIVPDYVEGQYLLGVILSEKRDYRAAIERFQKAIELKSDYAEAYFQLGLCHDRLDERQGAIDAFQMALRCQPEMPQAHRMLGEKLVDEGRPLEGLIHLQAALRLNPDDEKAKDLIKGNLTRLFLPITP
jgi:tetratricopeptide (TPR) repeat protein